MYSPLGINFVLFESLSRIINGMFHKILIENFWSFLSVFSGLSKYASWNEWSSCSKTCGDGDRTRVRSCISYCDNIKSSDLSSTRPCNVVNCKSLPSIFSFTTMTPTTTTKTKSATEETRILPKTSPFLSEATTTMTQTQNEGKIWTVKVQIWVIFYDS